MVQPFDYSLNIQRPDQALASGFNMGAQLRQARMQREQMDMQQQQQSRLMEGFKRLRPGMDAIELAGVINEYPDLAKPLTEQYNTYDDVTKNAIYGGLLPAYAAMSSGGSPDLAIGQLERLGEAFGNINRADLAEQATVLAKMARTDPAGASVAIGAFLAAADPAKFKQYTEAKGGQSLTSFQKDLAAANIDPESDEGKALARDYVRNRVDPIVTMETPNGRQFIGPQSVYMERFGAGAGAPQRLPVISSEAAYKALPSGAQFVAPDGSVRRKP